MKIETLKAGDKITKPGAYLMPVNSYFADPAPVPSLTQSIAKILLDHSPKHAWLAHPRLNPVFEADDPTKYDTGNIGHSLLIGRGKELQIVQADDWRTKLAKEAREEAAKNGKLGVLEKDYEIGLQMAAAARHQLDERGFDSAFTEEGYGELVLAWQEGPIWLRTMIDWLEPQMFSWDYKSTKASAAPHAVATRLQDGGWEIQAAMHERGLDALDPENAGRRKFRFVLQESEPPYALTVAELDEHCLTLGRRRLAVAIEIWKRATEKNLWPMYPLETVHPQYPSYAETRWLERETEYEAAGLWPKDLNAPPSRQENGQKRTIDYRNYLDLP